MEILKEEEKELFEQYVKSLRRDLAKKGTTNWTDENTNTNVLTQQLFHIAGEKRMMFLMELAELIIKHYPKKTKSI